MAVRGQSGLIIWAYLLVEGYKTNIGKKEKFSHFYSKNLKGRCHLEDLDPNQINFSPS